jgi:hypothetical protein
VNLPSFFGVPLRMKITLLLRRRPVRITDRLMALEYLMNTGHAVSSLGHSLASATQVHRPNCMRKSERSLFMSRARSRRRKEAETQRARKSASLRRRLQGSWSQCAPTMAWRLSMSLGRKYPGVTPRAEAFSVAERLECGSLLPLSDLPQRRQVARTPNAGATSAGPFGSWPDAGSGVQGGFP